MLRRYEKIIIFFWCAIFLFICGCSSYVPPEDIIKDAIKTNANIVLMKKGQSNFVYSDTKVNSYEIVDSYDQKTTKGTYKIIKYKAKITAYASGSSESSDFDIEGTTEFIQKEGHWWYQNTK